MHRIEITRDARTNLDGIDGLDAARELTPLENGSLYDLRSADLHRRHLHLARARPATAASSEKDNDRRERRKLRVDWELLGTRLALPMRTSSAVHVDHPDLLLIR